MQIGLALGSGAARGLAHIGVLQGLVEAGIPVFLLVGNHDLPNALGRAGALDSMKTCVFCDSARGP